MPPTDEHNITVPLCPCQAENSLLIKQKRGSVLHLPLKAKSLTLVFVHNFYYNQVINKEYDGCYYEKRKHKYWQYQIIWRILRYANQNAEY